MLSFKCFLEAIIKRTFYFNLIKRHEVKCNASEKNSENLYYHASHMYLIGFLKVKSEFNSK